MSYTTSIHHIQGRRNRWAGRVGDPLSQLWAGQLSLFQSGEEGQIMTFTLLLSPSPDFQTFLRPCHILHICDFSLLTVWPSKNAVFAR